MIEKVGAIVIGAGVVGLACARQLALGGIETVILEAHGAIGTETSSRNSEVIHAGIYYPPASLKASLCVRGRHALYEYCEARGIAARRCGKLIVATSEAQLPALEELRARARAHGVLDLSLLTAAQARAIEPELHCHAALLSPSTGIVDSHGLMLSLLGEAQEAGAMLALNSPLVSAAIEGGFVVEVGGTEPMQVGSRILINAAGLHAADVAGRIRGLARRHVPPVWLAKGNYYSLSGRAPFSRLIYPIPEPGGLGVHLTLDLGGQARFGPDVEWVESIDYRVAPERAKRFYAEVRQYWPGLPDESLAPAYCGIRPKLAGPGQAAVDFLIQGPADHGVPGLVNLFGIESPGLTSCLAIGEHVARTLDLARAR